MEGHPVKLRAGPQQVLEGPVPELVAILEFPTTTAARQWYDGPIGQRTFFGLESRAPTQKRLFRAFPPAEPYEPEMVPILPSRKSRKAFMISSRVFITNGP